MAKRRVDVAGPEGSREWWRSIAADSARQRTEAQRAQVRRVGARLVWRMVKGMLMLAFWYVLGYPIWVVGCSLLRIASLD